MESRILAAREKVKPLGAHTSMGYLHAMQKWKDLPFLRENEGMLPPFIICVGDRRRVLSAPSVLNLKQYAFIDQEAGKMDPVALGRVALLVGMANARGFDFPIAVIESQMGCPAAQINMREALYFAESNRYEVDGLVTHSDGIYVIRAGTCAGVNSHKKSEYRLKIGDIAIANKNFGSVGALVESILGTLSLQGFDARKKLAEVGEDMMMEPRLAVSYDSAYLNNNCSSRIILQLLGLSNELNILAITGGNFTKDSLYAEMDENRFAELRDTYGIISSEMEQMAISALAAEFTKAGIPAYSALVSAVIGAIPGKSFPETAEEFKAAKKAEENTMILACSALGEIAKGINQ